jgi:hypothetical protein
MAHKKKAHMKEKHHHEGKMAVKEPMARGMGMAHMEKHKEHHSKHHKGK